MITLSRKLIYYSAAAIFLLVTLSACAQTMPNIKDDKAASAGNSSVAFIQAINVSGDASQIEILADKPLSYTYYKTIEPPKVVIDIAQADPGTLTRTIEVNAGNIKRIEVAKHEFTGGILSRIEVIPTKDVGEYSVTTDAVDKGKLLITFVKSPAEEKKVAGLEAKPLAATDLASANVVAQQTPGVAIEENKEKQQAPNAVLDATKEEQQPEVGKNKDAIPAAAIRNEPATQSNVLSAITVNDENIEITVNGGVETFSAFKLNKPDRIVLDMRGIKNGINVKSISINKFGVGQARIGNYPGKVRIVLDAIKNSLPAYQVVKSANGLKVILGDAAVRQLQQVSAGSSDTRTDEKTPVGVISKEANAAEPNSASIHQQKVLSAIAPNDEGIEIIINGGIDTYTSFNLTKPDRIVLDVPGVKSGIPSKPIVINKYGVSQARIGSYPDKLRIVLDPAKDILPSHQIMKSANGLKVIFAEHSANSGGSMEKASSNETAGNPPGTKKAARSGVSSIEAVDFSIVGDYSQIALKLGGNCSLGKISHAPDGLVLAVHKCQVPRKLQRMIDTSAFPSVVQQVIPYQVKVRKGYDARILVKLRQKAVETNLKPDGSIVYWSFKNPDFTKNPAIPFKSARELSKTPSDLAAAQREKAVQAKESEYLQDKQHSSALKPGEKKVYTGRRVSLEFSDADIRKILQLIAEVSNLNFLIGDDVSGTLSIKLVNVPWDQALEVILETKGLEKRQDGNIMYVKPKGKFKSEDQEASEALKEHERRMDLKTVVFEISFAAVDEIASQFDKLKSDRGTISKDGRTSRVIVTDISDRIDKMQFLLKALDMPEKQVMIEARIVEATSTFTRDLGVQWGLHYKDGSASILGVNKFDLGLGGIVTPPPTSGTSGPGGSAGISFGKLSNSVQLDLRLSAAATLGQIKVISTPKVVTLNNKAAKISQGQSIPYQTTSAEGTKTEFVEAALTLEVTPHVANDGSISMKIKASNNSAGTGSPPSINKKEATTEVQVMNGETTVIGGIYQDNDTESDTGVPFLQDIPFFGWLFKSNTKSKTKTELLIFITPKIIS